ncbi:hypothetical protein GYMLUDRAFT_50501 [Collybiopsis luxurians FD-317 M1]|uniref:P-loop containing nucleoside triphosphate hydrolase protein n=1 Tax=Collybiopsis luxurians FD-317 M1 TaxID=944289 RepID=A0A0D0C9V0_9AGAR|nr:hypothetical protein GYMLUDRAFT_50501 [Collybiopsis luxurians FD-317 M1]
MEVAVLSQVPFRLDVLRNNALFSDPNNPRMEPRDELLTVYAAAVSAALLLVHFTGSRIVAHFRKTPANEDTPPHVTRNWLRKQVGRLGGGWIFGYMVGRLVVAVALTVLSLVSLGIKLDKGHGEGSRIDIGLSIVSAYTVLLSFFSLLLSFRRSSILTRHANTLWLFTFAIFAYRDLYPSATFDLTPVDIEEGRIIWVKIALLAILAIVIPLAIPRMYIPYNPKEPSSEPNPEQTTSLFSLLLYNFMDPIVFEARRVEHLPYDHLPPLADYDYARNLRERAFKHLDRFSGLKKRRHLFFSLMRIYWRQYLVLSLMTVIQAVADLSIPVGMNELLQYIENRGPAPRYRPWVWIVWLLVGPTISSIAFEWYIFVATRNIVHTESIITQVVFEHALRIRVKAETSKNESDRPTPALPSETGSLAEAGSSPPSPNSEDGGPARDESGAAASASDNDDDETLHSAAQSSAAHSRDDTLRVASSSSAGGQSHSGSLKGVPGAGGRGPVLVASRSGSLSSFFFSKKSGKDKDKDKDKDKEKEKEKEKASDSSKNLVGKLNNLVSTDLQNVVDGRDFIRLVVLVPIQVALCVWFLYNVLGWSAFVGLGVIVVLFPVPGWLTNLIQKAQRARMKRTDARVQVVTEIMNVLRMVKMFGWEKKMLERIFAKREEELGFIKRLRLLGLMTAIANHTIPVLTMLATFATYTLVMGEELTASKVFSSMVVFEKFSNLLRMMIWMTTLCLNGKVSLDRITNFLYDTELLDKWSNSGGESAPIISSPPPAIDAIGFRKATFTWSAEDDDNNADGDGNGSGSGSHTPSRRRFLLRIEDELLFKKGVVNLIVGQTGSGKTSVLMALLSEMHFVPSGPDSWYGLPRAGGIAYAAQESWVQNATIRDNIVFGAEFDEERYKKVIYQCCLEKDLELFDAGDQTEVGERGLTLSGGQKARVTLARAVYSRAEIILLDDVLAALDVHTSKWIVDKCLKGDLIRGRTVLLVTHNVVLVQPITKFVVSIKDGRVASQSSIEHAMSADEALAAEVEKDEEAVERARDEIDPQPAPNEPSGKDGKLILKEEVELGHVSWSALKLFFASMGGNHIGLFFFAFIGLFLASELSENGQIYFLGYWARQYEKVGDPSQVNVPFYLAIYVAILAVLILTFCVGYVIYLWGVLRASRMIHQRLVTSVVGATLRWLDTTPTSRVITRCTQDIRDVDDPLAQMFSGLVSMTLGMIIKFLAVIILTPAFLLPATFVGLFGAWCGNVYIHAQLPVKREMSNAKAPVLGHFGAAMNGLTSIRAYGVEESFRKEVQVRIDHYSRPARTFYNLNRWIDVRVDAISNIFAVALASYLLYIGHDDASDVGFLLNMAVGFSGTILWWIRVVNQFEVRGNSLERIGAYITIEQEKPPIPEGVPPAYWPATGHLRVEDLSASYSPDGPKVLRNLSFEVQSGERIGVVGRTGSGKSSLMLSLLRLIYSDGSVHYDSLPTSSINLEDLRRKITIIPQIPELLSGSVRENLDPFGQQDDATLNSALRSAGLFSLQEELDEGEDRITLDSAVASGGNNLSVGQRQIVALARAMVRESKLLILDEATSAIDYKTDTIIQSSLRNELDKETTLITVAHRLQTIMDADKIMVLDAGQIVEFDRPAELLKNKDGKLRALVDESADKEHLLAMVRAKEHLDHSGSH